MCQVPNRHTSLLSTVPQSRTSYGQTPSQPPTSPIQGTRNPKSLPKSQIPTHKPYLTVNTSPHIKNHGTQKTTQPQSPKVTSIASDPNHHFPSSNLAFFNNHHPPKQLPILITSHCRIKSIQNQTSSKQPSKAAPHKHISQTQPTTTVPKVPPPAEYPPLSCHRRSFSKCLEKGKQKIKSKRNR
ncbi:hypothetical protein CFOL_v3_36241 [Cephalotus follicularis]|uniref:Uncharacterized protein n=1 Tax=Cephalotus follicularis TaxID=3775 RepID=A0A1Q3DKL9_CEPFO|nr:hypothetical protein CFOL_v3_36241 [Cephalotus follicularis]